MTYNMSDSISGFASKPRWGDVNDSCSEKKHFSIFSAIKYGDDFHVKPLSGNISVSDFDVELFSDDFSYDFRDVFSGIHNRSFVLNAGRLYINQLEQLNVFYCIVDFSTTIKGVSQQEKLMDLISCAQVSQGDMSDAIGILWWMMRDWNLSILDKALYRMSEMKLLPKVFIAIVRVVSSKREKLQNWNNFLREGCKELSVYSPDKGQEFLDKFIV